MKSYRIPNVARENHSFLDLLDRNVSVKTSQQLALPPPGSTRYGDVSTNSLMEIRDSTIASASNRKKDETINESMKIATNFRATTKNSIDLDPYGRLETQSKMSQSMSQMKNIRNSNIQSQATRKKKKSWNH